MFPIVRKRRLRRNQAVRDLVAESRLLPSDLIYPLFVCDQRGARIPVPSMPGIYQQSPDNALIEAGQLLAKGVNTFLLFGIPQEKDQEATSAWFEDGIIQRTARAFRKQFGDEVVLIADTCLCEYMTHGHCGVYLDGRVLNDPTLELLARTAVSQAEAGVDMVAPSDMMDGRVIHIRDSLDEAGFQDTAILSYAVKYNSSLYGPFREAADSTPGSGDRRGYQMDYRNAREALDEASLDVEEGADILLVKPATGYQDILVRLRERCNLPLFAYSVSGEYAMIKAAAEKGWLNEQDVVLEQLYGLKRAGADRIITYHAPLAADWLK
ncbi:MAG: porphobilinogen synthase [Candidatus Melainabacteria bacterium]